MARLHQAIGNRAVAQLLRAADPAAAAAPSRVLARDDRRRKPAPGGTKQAPVATGNKPQSPPTPAKVADAATATRVAERATNAVEREIDDSYQHIEKLKELRIDAWKTNAQIPDDKPDDKILEIVIAIVAEGMGGVVYGLIEGMLHEDKATHDLVREFMSLAGLEAGDLAAEAIFRKSLLSAREIMELGNVNARTKDQIDAAITGALKKGVNPLEVYVEAAKNNALDEQVQGQDAFNKKSPTMSDEELAGLKGAQALVYRRLARQPELFQRELTVGYLRMLEELDLKFNHDNASETKMWGHWPSPGEITLVGSPTYRQNIPDRSLRNAEPWDLGDWRAPNVNFDGFEAHAKIVNAATLEDLTGAKARDVNLTEIFSFLGKNPYEGWMEGRGVYLIFRRDAAGRFRVARMGSENAYEWFTSYYTRESRDHTEDEQDKFAPLGAEKLYNQIKDKVIKSTRIL
ncbi:MAG TPA: hypothetical protein VE571_00855 [Solirubrobacteraceae bacterium]|nr:hypothetical protein [Solirubrobacteraceae bacterium]